MADISDIETALVGLIAGAVYPTGVPAYTPPAVPVSTVIGAACNIARGWPNGQALDADLAAGIVNVTVFQKPGSFRELSKPFDAWTITAAPTPTLTATIAGAVTTFAGTGGAGQVAAMIVGPSGQTIAYAYRLGASDTPSTVAAAFAAAISQATATGPALTLTTTLASVVIVADVTAINVVSKQEQAEIVTIWSPSDVLRDATAKAIIPPLLAAYRLTMPDATQAITWRVNDVTTDATTPSNIWRRDITFMTRYTTVISASKPLVTAVIGNIIVNDALLVQIGSATVPGSVYVDAGGDMVLDGNGNLIGVHQ
jgi:hypothetical protein